MANDLHTLPQAERLLSGTLQEAINETATEFEVSNPPSDLPTYIEIDPDSSSLKELVRVTAVTGNNITVERGLNNGGTGFSHSSLATYKQNFTSLHYKNVVDAIESGYLSEDTSYTFTRVSTSSFKVVASGVDRTARYTAGRRLRLNGSVEVAVVSSSYSNPDTTVIVNATTVPATITSIEMEIGTEERFELVSELKATGAEINTGTEDAKIVTPKAIADSWLNNGYNSLYRQAIINGNFDVWQRGTTSTNPANGALLADRWMTFIGADGGALPSNIIHSRQLLTSGDIAGSFYHYRVAVDGAGTSLGVNSYGLIRQRIEHGTRFLCGDGKKVTVSFYARSSIANKKLSIGMTQHYGTGGTPTANEKLTGTTVSLTASWVKYTYTFTTNTLAGKTFGTDNNDYLSLDLPYMWGATDGGTYGYTGSETFVGAGNIDIAQVQLCAGDVALPFMPRSFEEELRACQRYCYAPATPTAYSYIGSGSGASATRVLIFVKMPVTMRTSPTLTITVSDWQMSDFAGAPFDLTDIAINTTEVTPDNVPLNCDVGSGITAYRPYQLVADNNANRLMIFSSEL